MTANLLMGALLTSGLTALCILPDRRKHMQSAGEHDPLVASHEPQGSEECESDITTESRCFEDWIGLELDIRISFR